MCIAAAILGAAAIGAVGSVVAGGESASATQNATNASVGEQQNALAQQAALSAPYRQMGEGAIPKLESLLGIGGGGQPSSGQNLMTIQLPNGAGQITLPANLMGAGPDSAETQGGQSGWTMGPGGQMIPLMTNGPGASTVSTGAMSPGSSGSSIEQALASTPGYQFTLNQGLDATKNAASASGMLLSGNTLQGLDEFSTGLADKTYQETVGNLENVVGMGQAAAAGQAANIGNAAGNISSALINQGTNMANIDANTIAGITGALNNGINQYTMYNTLQALNSPYQGPVGT